MPTIQTLKTFWESVLYAYSQIFFSKHKGLAYLVFIGSFVNWEVGLLGMAGVVFTNLAARWFGFDRHTTDEGLFGLNSLLVCLALAVGFDINGQFWVVFFIVCLFTLFLSVMLSKVLGVWGLPMLSLPFLFSVWVVTLAVRHYSSLELNSSGVYVINHLYSLGGTSLVKMYESMNDLPIPDFVDDYLKSLGAIIFQYNLITGTLIAVGLFIGSRISFSLSLIGFGTGYLYYYWVEGDVSQLHYSHIGFNFILCSIALGGFFFIPSVKTYLLTAVMVPIVALLIAATAAILLPFGLPVFSLPFVFTVLLVLISVQGGVRPKDFVRVIYQSYSPEKNLYGYRASVERFNYAHYMAIGMPFEGEWAVSQGHNGEFTHQGDYRFAWDFMPVDSKGSYFSGDGKKPEDYYGYDRLVLAPAAGYVVAVADHIADNAIDHVNLESNWGNSVVIKHAEYLYSQSSHLKPGSILVWPGQYVYKGQAVARLGNSGRSPQPHIHFQIHALPYIGVHTMDYPMGYYIKKQDGKAKFFTFERPQKGDILENPRFSWSLYGAVALEVGKRFVFDVETEGKTQQVHWEVFPNPTGQVYLYCKTSRSWAYFTNDGMLQYFTSFEGDKNSLLYYFYLGINKFLFADCEGLTLDDTIPQHQYQGGFLRYAQDFLAPFVLLQENTFSLENLGILQDGKSRFRSEVKRKFMGATAGHIVFDIEVSESRISLFLIKDGGKTIQAKAVAMAY